mmetsp:Transcript_9904/g.28480  ORF Transcript_9904/g.28480 Transcript_9904/m.28480 type:complete len:582 (+) Transcript_9904:355-2100(+)
MSGANSRLARVLGGDEDLQDHMEIQSSETDADAGGMVTEAAAEGFCVECKDQRATLRCLACEDDYCRVCFQMQHRKGQRATHATRPIGPSGGGAKDADEEMEDLAGYAPPPGSSPGSWFLERAKYIPVRLTLKERKMLRLLEAVISVSSYTDRIDTGKMGKAKRTHAQLHEICSVLSALVVALDYREGQNLAAEHNYKDHEAVFQTLLEVGRRHKIMNPEKMRGEYGKLVYLLQDSVCGEVQQLLDMSTVRPICTVHRFLEERGALKVLEDDLITTATREIIADGVKSRVTLNRESKEKHRAIEILGQKYASRRITEDEIKQCLYSIGDNHSFLTAHRDPVDKMVQYLTTLFRPDRVEPGYDLSICGGVDGARLSHSHEKQYYFVLQSLTLWREIAHDMFRLWCLSEEDLLDPDNRYELRDTGQGLQRVQQAPRISKAMRNILHATQEKVGHWIGSSVVHLGDNNVPNALHFIDKYTQISCILNPIVVVLKLLPELCKDPIIETFIRDEFGGPDRLRKDILVDFFRSAFDGSGADNFYDAGSCIDGRLTSAWNWCNQIGSKPFYPVFRLAGFSSFDGEFQR